jgi:hypothetical protein
MRAGHAWRVEREQPEAQECLRTAARSAATPMHKECIATQRTTRRFASSLIVATSTLVSPA